MWIKTSSVLLAILVVSGLSLPRPDDDEDKIPDEDEYEIPEVGTGERSQFYVLHPDGTFSYGYDTGDGAFETAKLLPTGDLEGKFGYTDSEGTPIHLEYEAGKGGFVARGDHLPRPWHGVVVSLDDEIAADDELFVDPLAREDSDPSYHFAFQSNDHSRNEQSDSNGTVIGSYSYVDDSGVTRSFTYRAGKGIGFTIEEDDLNLDIPPSSGIPLPSVQENQPTKQVSQSSQYSIQNTYKPPQNLESLIQRTLTPPEGGKDPSFLGPLPSTSYKGSKDAVAFMGAQAPGEAPHSLFDLGGQLKPGSSDNSINADGNLSIFVADHGDQKTGHVADSSIGFQGQGNHSIQIPPGYDSGIQVVPRGHTSETSSHHGFKAETQPHQHTAAIESSVPEVVGYYIPPSVTIYGSQNTGTPHNQSSASSIPEEQNISSFSVLPFEIIKVLSTFFSLDPNANKTSNYPNSESGATNIKIVGELDFSDDDGNPLLVSYEAQTVNGISSEGGLPEGGVEVPQAPPDQLTKNTIQATSVPLADPLGNRNIGGSYDFPFNSDTYPQRESFGRYGNVEGWYTVIDLDGTKRTYNFKAGDRLGLHTEEVSRNQDMAPVVTSQTSSSLINIDGSQGGTGPSSSYLSPNTQEIHNPIGGKSLNEEQALFFPSDESPVMGSEEAENVVPDSPNPDLKIHFKDLPDLTLNRYDVYPGSEKYGYVIRYN